MESVLETFDVALGGSSVVNTIRLNSIGAFGYRLHSHQPVYLPLSLFRPSARHTGGLTLCASVSIVNVSNVITAP